MTFHSARFVRWITTGMSFPASLIACDIALLMFRFSTRLHSMWIPGSPTTSGESGVPLYWFPLCEGCPRSVSRCASSSSPFLPFSRLLMFFFVFMRHLRTATSGQDPDLLWRAFLPTGSNALLLLPDAAVSCQRIHAGNRDCKHHLRIFPNSTMTIRASAYQ